MLRHIDQWRFGVFWNGAGGDGGDGSGGSGSAGGDAGGNSGGAGGPGDASGGGGNSGGVGGPGDASGGGGNSAGPGGPGDAGASAAAAAAASAGAGGPGDASGGGGNSGGIGGPAGAPGADATGFSIGVNANDTAALAAAVNAANAFGFGQQGIGFGPSTSPSLGSLAAALSGPVGTTTSPVGVSDLAAPTTSPGLNSPSVVTALNNALQGLTGAPTVATNTPYGPPSQPNAISTPNVSPTATPYGLPSLALNPGSVLGQPTPAISPAEIAHAQSIANRGGPTGVSPAAVASSTPSPTATASAANAPTASQVAAPTPTVANQAAPNQAGGISQLLRDLLGVSTANPTSLIDLASQINTASTGQQGWSSVPSSSNVEFRGQPTWFDNAVPSIPSMYPYLRALQLLRGLSPAQQAYLQQNFPSQIPSTPISDGTNEMDIAR